jgi:hypothetical protein
VHCATHLSPTPLYQTDVRRRIRRGRLRGYRRALLQRHNVAQLRQAMSGIRDVSTDGEQQATHDFFRVSDMAPRLQTGHHLPAQHTKTINIHCLTEFLALQASGYIDSFVVSGSTHFRRWNAICDVSRVTWSSSGAMYPGLPAALQGST